MVRVHTCSDYCLYDRMGLLNISTNIKHHMSFFAEIYSDIVFDAPHSCAAVLEGDSLVDPQLLAIVSGVSKGAHNFSVFVCDKC